MALQKERSKQAQPSSRLKMNVTDIICLVKCEKLCT